MNITCNEIPQIAAELQMRFSNCSVLKAEDLDLLVDLVQAIASCTVSGAFMQNNIIDRIELTPAVDRGVQSIADRVNSLPLFTVNEDRIFVFSALETDISNGVVTPFTSIYMFKLGKGVYGSGSVTTTTTADFIFLNAGSTLVADISNIINSNIKSVGTGVAIYDGLDLLDSKHKIKSINSPDLSVIDDTIDITLNTENINESTGTGEVIYNGYVGNTHRFKSLVQDPVGTPIFTAEADEINIKSLKSDNGTVVVTQDVNAINLEVNAAINPIGLIALWFGSIATIPAGWAFCDGANGTPDLRNVFIIGANQDIAGIPNTNVTGGLTNVGGSKDAVVVEHTHTVTDAGHTHTVDSRAGTMMGDFINSAGGGAPHDDTLEIRNTVSPNGSTNSSTSGITVDREGVSGDNQNLPPYKALAYIMYTG